MSEEEIQTLIAERDALLAALEEMKAELEKLKKPAEEEAPAEDMAAQEALSAALSELRVLRTQMGQMQETARLSERKTRVEACLSSGKLMASERVTAERLFDRDPTLFAEVYESRLASSAVPMAPIGHGQAQTTPDNPATILTAKVHEMLSDARGKGLTLGIDEAYRKVLAQNPQIERDINARRGM